MVHDTKLGKYWTLFSMDKEKQSVNSFGIGYVDGIKWQHNQFELYSQYIMSQIVFCKYTNERSYTMADTYCFVRSKLKSMTVINCDSSCQFYHFVAWLYHIKLDVILLYKT